MLGWSPLDCPPYSRPTTTLHIEHPISDYATERTACDCFAHVRADAGVTNQRISRPKRATTARDRFAPRQSS